MPARPNSHVVRVQLTDAQYEALVREAERLDVDMSVLIRRILSEHVAGFPGGDFIQRGTYPRKKQPPRK